VSAHAASIWRAVRQAEPRDSCLSPILATLSTYEDLKVHKLYDLAAAEAREFRRDRWHTWCNDTEHRAKLFRWVRAADAIPCTTIHEVVTGTPDMRLLEAHTWWSSLWNPAQAPAPDTSRFGQCLTHLPGCEAMPALTGADIGHVLRVTPSGKAAGHDGWRYDEIKVWPQPLITLLAGFYGVVERTGLWPAAMGTNLVALLPKGTSGDPGDYRPIMLLSVIYRIWAKARSTFMQGHLRAIGILPTGPIPGAEQQATDLAWRLLLAKSGVVLSGVALDWSKCYDHVSSVLLGHLARLCRLPEGLFLPMLAAYNMQRHILLGGMLGPAKAPARGLAAGCPRATDWMAIMSYVLVRELQQTVPTTSPRPYVDDLTADIEHPDTDDGREDAVLAVTQMESTIQEYAVAWELVPNMTKSRHFSTSAAVRASLTIVPGFPVMHTFKDLGVVQTTTDQPDTAALMVRDEESFRRLNRAEILPLPLAVRALVVGASPGSVGAYGLTAQPISNLRLRTLRSATFRAVWRSPGPSALDLVFELLVPWRCDPGFLACTKPLIALRDGMLRGTISGNRTAAIWDLSFHAGPLRAVMDSCRRLAIVIDPLTWSITGHNVLSLLSTPLAQLTTFLGKAWFASRRAILCVRRPALLYLEHGIDHYAFRTACRPLPTEARKAALRVLAVDGSITQTKASHWVPGGNTCPHCRLEDETIYHRLWRCPAWERTRAQHLKEWTEVGLREVLPGPTMLSGVLPVQVHLATAQQEAELPLAFPAPQHLSGTAYCDGSCLHPTDPWLARATWAVATSLDCAHRWVTLAAQRVSGTQTVGRAELSALVWLTHCTGDFRVVTDCLYLQLRFEKLRHGPMPPHWAEGVNGDLWRLVQRTDLVVEWIPSHLTVDEAVARGHDATDWAGNCAVDDAAGQLASQIDSDPGTVSQRTRQILALTIVHSVISAVEEAVLCVHHDPKHPIAKRRKRRKRLVLRRPKRRARLRPAPPAPAPAANTCGVHSLAFGHGPMRVRPPEKGNLSWPVHCTACHQGVTGTGRWRAFSLSRCPAVPAAVHLQRHLETHDLVRCAGGWFCCRCHRTVSSSQHATAARQRCHIPVVTNGAGIAQPAAVAALCANVLALAAWRTWAASPGIVALPVPPPAAVPPAGRPLLVWHAHWRVRSQHGGNVQDVCLRCGAWSSRRAPRRVQASACTFGAPITALTGQAHAVLLAGSLDAGLTVAPRAWVDQAILLGWTPLRGD